MAPVIVSFPSYGTSPMMAGYRAGPSLVGVVAPGITAVSVSHTVVLVLARVVSLEVDVGCRTIVVSGTIPLPNSVTGTLIHAVHVVRSVCRYWCALRLMFCLAGRLVLLDVFSGSWFVSVQVGLVAGSSE